MTFRIHDLRKSQGLTQGQLAEKLDVRISTVSQWENGQRAPSARLLPALAAALGCSIDELFAAPEPAQKESAS